MFKTTYYLNNLSCAHCASQVEKELNKLSFVEKATISFATEILFLETPKELSKKEEASLIATCQKIESNLEIMRKDQYTKPLFKKKISLPRILLLMGAILFVLSIILPLTPNLKLLTSIVAYLLIGYPILLTSLKNILKGQFFDENFLMSIASLGAFAIGQPTEGIAVMLFYQIGELVQDKAVNNAKASIEKLLDLRPDTVSVLEDNKAVLKDPNQVPLGSLILIKPGEKIPLDGVVFEGSSTLDTSPLTGESRPQNVSIGDDVLSGSINISGLLTLKTTTLFRDSTIAKILDLVENASSKKAKTEQFITKFAAVYTPIIVFLAIFIALIPPLILGAPFGDWINRALVFLVVSCPCALVISIPLGFFGGIGGASKNGILIKGSNYLEALNKMSVAVFDKTGTLTKGDFTITEMFPAPSLTESRLLEIGAYGEYYSNHPIAKSIVSFYGQELDHNRLSNFTEFSGHGLSVLLDGQEILLGNATLLRDHRIDFSEINSIGTPVYVAFNGSFYGTLVIGDTLRGNASKALDSLKELGVHTTVMLTGDTREVGEALAKTLNMSQAYTNLLPQDKVHKVEELIKGLKGKDEGLFVVGDGINDAPVLALAPVSFAMGGLGSDAAIEAADIVIMDDDLLHIPQALRIAKFTKRIVWQNIIFAFSIKFLVLILGAFGYATIWEAVFADVGVALIAILNATRVIHKKYKL